MEKLRQAFDLATILVKTLVRLFNALGLAGGVKDDLDSASYYEYLNAVHDGAADVLDYVEKEGIVK